MARFATSPHNNTGLLFNKAMQAMRRLLITSLVFVLTPTLTPAVAQSQPSSPKEALTAADLCRDTFNKRTQLLQIDNRTNLTSVVAFLQGRDESTMVPPGYVTNTGVFVAGVNQPGPSVVAGDPCYAGGHQRPIQATRVLASIILEDPITGVDFPINLPDQNGDITSYWLTALWTIDFSPVTRMDGKRIPEAHPVKRKKNS